MYVAKGDLVDIDVTVKRGGSALTGSSATVTVDIVHPVGFVVIPVIGNNSSLGSQSFEHTWEHALLIRMCPQMNSQEIVRLQ